MSAMLTCMGAGLVAFGVGGTIFALWELRQGGRPRFERWRLVYKKYGTGYDKDVLSLLFLTYTDIFGMATCGLCLAGMGVIFIWAALNPDVCLR
jgi:hypothetical protein